MATDTNDIETANMVRGWLLTQEGRSRESVLAQALTEATAIMRDIPRGAVSGRTDRRISEFLTKIGFE